MLTLPCRVRPVCTFLIFHRRVWLCARLDASGSWIVHTFIWWPLCVPDFDLVDAWLFVFVSQPPVEGSPPLQIKHIHRDWQFRWHDLRSQHQRLKFLFRGEPEFRRRRWWRLSLRRRRRAEVVIAGNALSRDEWEQSEKIWQLPVKKDNVWMWLQFWRTIKSVRASVSKVWNVKRDQAQDHLRARVSGVFPLCG